MLLASAQTNGVEINYNDPRLIFYTEDTNDGEFLIRDEIDLSKLKYTYDPEQKGYAATFPFVVRENIGDANTFWFMKHIPANSTDFAWMIYNPNGKGICNRFSRMNSVAKTRYVLQGQEHLNEQVVPGTYTVKIWLTEIPKEKNIVYMRVGKSSKIFYAGFTKAFMLGRY